MDLIKFKIITLFFLLMGLSIDPINSQSYVESYEKIKGKSYSLLIRSSVDSLVSSAISQDSIRAAIKIIHDYSLVLYRQKNYHEGLKYVLWEKRVYEEDEMLRLEPDNRRHRVLRVPKIEVISLGRVVAKWTKYV